MSTYDTVIHHTIEDVAHELYSVHPEVNVPHLVFTLLAGELLPCVVSRTDLEAPHQGPAEERADQRKDAMMLTH